MRILATLALVIGLSLTPSLALADADGVDQALLGLNGIVTSPADPFVEAVSGTDLVDVPVLTNFVGFFTGSWTAVKRAALGTGDVAMAIFPVTALSPEPRFFWLVDENQAEGLPEKPEGF